MNKKFYKLLILLFIVFKNVRLFEITKGQKISPELFYRNGSKIIIDDIILSTNDTIELICSGLSPIFWDVPFARDSNTCIDNSLQESLVHKNGLYELSLKYKVSFENTGYYRCAYVNQTTMSNSSFASVYIYVKDDKHLLVPAPDDTKTPKIFGDKRQSVTIPCRPTTPNINMELFNNQNKIIDSNKSFDPKIGFTVKNITNGVYKCIANNMDRREEQKFQFKNLVSEIPKPLISKYNFNDIHFIGKNLKLNCTIKHQYKTFNYIIWKLPNTVRCSDERLNIETFGERNHRLNLVTTTSVLTIKNLTISDSGEYICISHNSTMMGNFLTLPQQQNRISVNVHEKHFIELTCDSSRNITEKAGTSMKSPLLIKVEAFPPVRYEWYHNGQKLNKTEELNKTQVQLKLINMQVESSGRYTLKVFNDYDEKTIDFFFIITDFPKFLELNGPQFVNSTEESKYVCKVKGNPIPTIEWYFNTTNCTEECKNSVIKLTEDAIFKTDLHANTSLLSFNASQPGILNCIAKNSINAKIYQSKKSLIISDIPNGFRAWKSEDTVIVGDSVILYCAAAPDYDLQWFLNDTKTIIKQDNKDYKFDIKSAKYSKHLNIIFKNVTRKFNGNYYCHGTNYKNGVVKSNQISLNIQDPKAPKIYNTNLKNDTIKKYNGSVRFEYRCYSEGMPSPTITWFKNNTIWVPNTTRINMPNNNTIVFDQLKKEDENIYSCMAQNRYGVDFRSSKLIIGEVGENVFLFWIIILVVCLIIILGIFLAILSGKLYYDKKTRSELKAIVIYNKNNDTSNGMHSNSSNSERTNLLTFCNKWEFSREKLKLQEMLGTGSFGCVMKAKAFGINPEEESTTVAVKMVKRNPHIMHIKALISELKIMMHLGEHDNIVNLLGACTNDLITNRELYVIVEYCLYGNLKKYLQQYRGNYVDQIATKDTECKTENNKIYLSKQNNCKIYTVDLFSWAVQIAKGMNYLTSRRVIHGDLAARNILLTEKKIAKICDFGLAENMCQKDNYVKKKKGLVPIKWMAVESIRDGKFSIKSDVWSFGVFLWELFSLGVEPYSDIAVDKKFYRKLESGYKLSKPKYAHDDELYTLMQQCWEIVPEKRPSFLDLNIDLEQMLKALKNKIISSSEYFKKQEKESNACANNYLLDKSKNEKGEISMEHPKPPEKNFKKPENQVACPNDYVPMAKSSNCKNGKTQNSSVNLETPEKSSECFVRFEISNGNEYLKMNSAKDAKLNRNPEDLQKSFNKHGNEYLNMAKSNFVNNQNFQLDSKISQHGRLQESVNVHGIDYLDMRSNFKDSNSQNLQLDPEIRDKNPECLQDCIKMYGNEYLNMSKTNRTDVNHQNLNSTPNTLFDSEIPRSVQEPVNEFGNRHLDMKKSNVIGSTYQNLNSSPTQSLERNDYLTMNGNKT